MSWKGANHSRLIDVALYDRSQVDPVGPAVGLHEALDIINKMEQP